MNTWCFIKNVKNATILVLWRGGQKLKMFKNALCQENAILYEK